MSGWPVGAMRKGLAGWGTLPITHISRLTSYLLGRNSVIVIDVVGAFLLSEVDESLVGIWGLVHQGQVSQHGAFDVGEHRPGGQFRGRSQAG